MDDRTLTDRLPAPVAARVQSIRASDGRVTVVLDASGLGPADRAALEQSVRTALEGSEGIAVVQVALTADRAAAPLPPRIIAIGAGKGGVGKSTLTANLARALKAQGRQVGLVDGDVYGPSQPTLLATEGMKPLAEGKKLVPVVGRDGIPMLSMGHLVEPGKALAWRGPMASGALTQLIDAEWGAVDTLLLDLPPGTGDVQITMLQKHRPAGAVIVSTPQDLSLIDARRAAQLFAQGQIPVIGMVENMAGFVCPHCGERSDPFGCGAVEEEARAAGIPFLGRIPLTIALREASDTGAAPADGTVADAFAAIAGTVGAWLDRESR